MQNTKKITLTLSGILLVIAIFIVVLSFLKNQKIIPAVNNPLSNQPSFKQQPFSGLKQFTSVEEFKQYLQDHSEAQTMYSGGALRSMPVADVMMKTEQSTMQSPSAMGSLNSPVAGGGGSERVSGTNVQVFGVDEPDIVKTDGSTLFYSLQNAYFRIMKNQPIPLVEDNDIQTQKSLSIEKRSIMPPRQEDNQETLSINVFPPTNLEEMSSINTSGDLLVYKNTLVIFSESNYQKRGIFGYDISDKKNPVQKWKILYKDNSYKLQGRLLHGKLYLVSTTTTDIEKPCPVMPFNESTLSIPCNRIYYPNIDSQTDSLFTVSRINMESGTIEDTISFLGSSNNSTVFMSQNAVYVGYYYTADQVNIFYNFIRDNTDIFPQSLVTKIEKLIGYDISSYAKQVELENLLSRTFSGMDSDKRKVFENNLENRMKKYVLAHSREFKRTGIVKINIDGLGLAAKGNVPGRLLNQFSLDEYQGNLRVASTIEGNSMMWNFGRSSQSISDVTVLDNNLQVRGTVQNLGKTERIFGVRFIADRGYVVTFRQTDPLYVLDLSNPGSPKVAGELKIPGYSAYLHPLDNDLLLGVGMEDGKVKVSLFNVKNADNPMEMDKYNLTDYWSEAVNNHHAFLADEKHKVFFMPGGQDGYVFSYANNKLSMIKAVTGIQAKRALYINDYLYIVGDQKIVVFDETNWNKAGELEL